MSDTIRSASMSRWKCLLAGAAMAMTLATSAHADDMLCVVTALAFDDKLNTLGVLGTADRPIQAANPERECARDKALSLLAAQTACGQSAEARFVAILRRADGVDLINSRNSKARFKEQSPDRETAQIKMRSCAYWLGRAQ